MSMTQRLFEDAATKRFLRREFYKRLCFLFCGTLFVWLLAVYLAGSAQARPYHHHHVARLAHRHHVAHVSHIAHRQAITPGIIVCNRFGCHGDIPVTITLTRKYHSAHTDRIIERGDPRPSLWCAWWLRRHLGIPRTAFRPYEWNLARGFLHIGSPAPRGCINCIAIFARGRGGHVGLVERWDANGNPIILSGNFNGGVAVAAHPLSRLIGLRWWS